MTYDSKGKYTSIRKGKLITTKEIANRFRSHVCNRCGKTFKAWFKRTQFCIDCVKWGDSDPRLKNYSSKRIGKKRWKINEIDI